MNDIGFGIFSFGDEKYINGGIIKVKHIIEYGIDCYVLTDKPERFEKIKNEHLFIIPYYRVIKSYSDKLILPKYILKNHEISILIDSDSSIRDYSIIKDLQEYNFNDGITYIDTLLNHRPKREYIKDLIDPTQYEWESYVKYAKSKYVDFAENEAIWEYFIAINKNGFNESEFYYHYERLQLMKEFCDLPRGKKVFGAGEGISIQISCHLSKTPIQRDANLRDKLSQKLIG